MSGVASDTENNVSSEQEEQTAAVEAVEEAPAPLEASLGDPEPEAIEPADGEPAAAVGEIAPNADAGGAAVTPAVEDEPIVVEPPTQRNDGKWTQGKYVADTLEDLVVKVETARRHAEKLIGKKQAAAEEDPFLVAGEFDEDEFELVDDVDFGRQVGQGVLSALQQAGFAQQQQAPDPQYAQAQALQIAQQAIDSPSTSDQEFRAVLAALIQADPRDEESRMVVLNEWAERRPAVAAQEATDIRLAFAQHQQQMQTAQAQQAYEAEQQQYAQEQQEVQQGAAEYRFGQETFVQQHPDWAQRNDGMNSFLQSNAWLMEAAKQVPVVDAQGRRTRAEAVSRVLKMAHDAADPVAGVSGGVSEHGGNMTNVTPDLNNIDAAAADRQRIAQQRDLAGLETGAMVDDVSISVAQKSPQGLAEASFTDLTGMRTVS